MFEALFGNDGSMTKAEFNAAFKSIIEQIIRFEKKLLDKNTDASDQLSEGSLQRLRSSEHCRWVRTW